MSAKDTLAKRVAFHCSNPGCHQPTSGPQENINKAINVGVAAHITAASSDGPRYDPRLTSEERRSADNAIWLCQLCAKLIDSDETRYTVEILRHWRTVSESAALRALEVRPDTDDELMFLRLEQLMPDLLEEMRKDLRGFPLRRDFVVLKKVWSYIARGDELVYYYEDHEDLDNKVRILENYRLIQRVKLTNVTHYRATEALARYLGA